nr:reverse transcriptase domain-containing protein [Tanacetum cinerariifolium]
PRVDPNLLNNFKMSTNGNGDDVPPPGGGDLPVPDLRMMEELCQPTLNGRGGPVAPTAIQATNFGLKNDMIQQTRRALIDVYEGELTLRVGKEAVTFNLDQTARYSSNYDAESVNRIDVINVACEEYSQEILGFSVSGNPTPYTKLIVSTSSPTLTPFGDGDFLLEETDAFLAIDDELI